MLKLVVDTNLFHEFRALKELPWAELGEPDEIVLIVSEVVFNELDAQKKSPKVRIKRRAVEWMAEFRKMTMSGVDEIEICGSSPRVVLKLDDTPVGSNNHGILNLSVLDDQLIAIAAAITACEGSLNVKVFSDDTRPLRNARNLKLGFLAIPDAWRRSDEQSEDEKEISSLKEKLRTLQSLEPNLSVAVSPKKIHEIEMLVHTPLGPAEIDKVIARIRQVNPIETNFERNKELDPRSKSVAFDGPSQHEFCASSPNDIGRYRSEDYPNWLASCRDALEELHLGLDSAHNLLRISMQLTNDGTRPASDVRVTVCTKGPLLAMPADGIAISNLVNAKSAFEVFPRPPEPPQGSWKRIDDLRGPFSSIFSPPMVQPFQVRAPMYDFKDLPPRDPNRFYYVSRPELPVAGYDLTCDQFRHSSPVEEFNLLISVATKSARIETVNGMVEFRVEAANVSIPVVTRVTLVVKFSPKSTMSFISKILG